MCIRDRATAVNGTSTPATSAKTIAAATGNFEFEKMSIAFNVNENLSLSWGELEETYDGQSATIADVEMSSTSIQFAYTMGSMSINAYSTERSNNNYDSDADKLNVNEIAIGLAF